MNKTGIVLGIVGDVMDRVGEALADGRVTLGEVFDMAFGLGGAIGGAFPKFEKRMYRLDDKPTTPKRIFEGFGLGIPYILDGFGVRDWDLKG